MAEVIGTCCCDQQCGGACPCCNCCRMPCKWRVTLSGIGNGVCNDCEHLNGTWTLVKGNACLWVINTNGTLCNYSPVGIELQCINDNFWELTVEANGASASWRLGVGQWRCLESNVMTLDYGNDSCMNWPATVTVTPILDQILDCCVGGCCGCNSVPILYRMDLPGVTDGTCTPCNRLTWPGPVRLRPWQLGLDPSVCEWTDGGLSPCGPAVDPSFLKLSCPAGDYFILVFTYNPAPFIFPIIAIYRKLKTAWSCLGANVMDLFSNTEHCATWPATVTLVPV